jgi:hypothetical protein
MWIVIILDDNNNYLPVTTIGPYETKDEAEMWAHTYMDRMDWMFPDFAMGYSYEVKAIHTFNTAVNRVASEILMQTRRDPYMRGPNWDGYMGAECDDIPAHK